MYLCHLIFPVILFSLGIISYYQPGSFLRQQKEVTNNYLFRSINHNNLYYLHSDRLHNKNSENTEKMEEALADGPGRLTSATGTMSVNDAGLLDPERVIQVGAFRLEPNALNLKNKLSALINKPVNIVRKDGFYKVQVTGFESPEEMEKLLPMLGLLGIKNIWILPPQKQKEVKSQIVVKADTNLAMIMVKLELPAADELKPLISRPIFILQIGVFHDRSKALRAQKRITNRLRLPVRIVREWEYYKVLITGFLSMEETFKYYPKLADMGYSNITMIATSDRKK